MSAAAIVSMMEAHLGRLRVEQTVALCDLAAQRLDAPTMQPGTLAHLVALRDWAKRHGGRAVQHGPSGGCEGNGRCAACTLSTCECCDRTLPADGLCGSCAEELEEEQREAEREAYLEDMADRQAEDFAAQQQEYPW